MRLLLDTHVLIWSVYTVRRLSPRVREAIEDPDVELLVSSVSAMEIATKVRTGKLEAVELIGDYLGYLRRMNLIELPITSQHMLFAGSFRNPHGDPWDRILAAQSILEGVPLVTDDVTLATFDIQRYW